MKFDTNVLHVNTPRVTESDFRFTSHFQHGGHDVISRRKVLPSSECTQSVCPAQLQTSSVRQFLIHSAFVLVIQVNNSTRMNVQYTRSKCSEDRQRQTTNIDRFSKFFHWHS